MVAIGLKDIATKEMEALEDIPGRDAHTSESFDGGGSIMFMFAFPRLLKTTFDVTDRVQKACADELLKGHGLIRAVHKIMLCLDFDAAGIEDGPTELRKVSIALCRWLWDFDNENTHPQLAVDGRTLFNSAFHNLQHVCAMAVQLWDTARVSIGRFSEQGNEALNKRLQFELIQRCNNCRVPELNKNMYAIALQNLWRDTFHTRARARRGAGDQSRR
jgi:hypothetical protein